MRKVGRGDLWRDLDVAPVEGPRYAIWFDDGDRSAGGGACSPIHLHGGGGAGFEKDCAAFEALEWEASGRGGGGRAYASHMVACQRLLDGGLPAFIAGNWQPPRWPALLQMARTVLSGNWPLRPQEATLRDRFASPKARAALSFQSLYVGLTPFAAPSVFGLLQVGTLLFFPCVFFFRLLGLAFLSSQQAEVGWSVARVRVCLVISLGHVGRRRLWSSGPFPTRPAPSRSPPTRGFSTHGAALGGSRRPWPSSPPAPAQRSTCPNAHSFGPLLPSDA